MTDYIITVANVQSLFVSQVPSSTGAIAINSLVPGPKGDTGTSIAAANVSSNSHLIITYSNGAVADAGNISLQLCD